MGDDLIDWLKTYSAELMRLARSVSNMGRPESDNNYGREAKRILEAADRIYALEGKLHQLSEDHSHCEDLLHELGERASRAEGRLSRTANALREHRRTLYGMGYRPDVLRCKGDSCPGCYGCWTMDDDPATPEPQSPSERVVERHEHEKG